MANKGGFVEKILKIREFEDKRWKGYEVTTSSQVIEIKIDNDQQCCESFGTICSNEDFDYYIDSELVGIDILDKEFELKEILIKNISDEYDGYAIFVNLITNLGTIQFALYNQHNGYYGHDVVISSKQITFKTNL